MAFTIIVQARYEGETFIRVLPKGQVPHTRYVRGSNYQHVAVFEDRLPGRAIIISGVPLPFETELTVLPHCTSVILT